MNTLCDLDCGMVSASTHLLTLYTLNALLFRKNSSIPLELEFSIILREGFDANESLGTQREQREDISAQDTALS